MQKEEKCRANKIIVFLYALIGFLFVLLTKSEYDLFEHDNIIWDLPYVGRIMLLSVLGGIAIGTIYVLGKKIFSTESRHVKIPRLDVPSRILFGISFLINLISYIPYLLAFYPGICAYDLAVQIDQIVKHAYNDHHPLFHTLLINLSLMLTKDVALCSIIQIVALSFAIALIIYTLNEYRVSNVWLLFVQLYFAINKQHGFMAVSITKDTLFTAFFVITVCSIVLLLKRKRPLYTFLYMLGVVGTCLFRNNGKYAVGAFLVVMLIATMVNKPKRKRCAEILLETLFSLIFAIVLLKTVFVATEAVSGDKREMLSVPLQQIARTMFYEEDKLTEEEKSLIDELILYRAYENYNPVISDPVKGKTNTSVVRYQAKRFLKIYLSLLRKYPGDYINATLALIGGYVSPFDETFRIMKVDGNIVTRNYIQHTFAAESYSEIVSEHSRWTSLKTRLDDYAENDEFMKPLARLFYIPGVYIWIIMILFVNILERKEYERLIPLFFILAFFGTLLLGPTMHLRYIYPVIVSIPLIILVKINET